MNHLHLMPRICLTPRLSGVGGMVSFQHKLLDGLASRGLESTYDLNDPKITAILVIGGTRQIPALMRARRRGIPIIQRLDGMNWVHRIRRTGWRHFLRAEYGNLILRTIRKQIASRIVYQSEFSRSWWEQVDGPTRVPNTVIYNGVDLESYNPQGPHERPDDRYRILLVEGSLMGGYDAGLEAAIGLAVRIANRACQPDSKLENRPVELMVVGKVAPAVQSRWVQQVADLQDQTSIQIHWVGVVPSQEIPRIDRSAHIYYSADVNAACPNSVIEALACGLPVVAFDTGALPELVKGGSGRIVAYGGNPWKLETPDIPALVQGAEEILVGWAEAHQAARRRAENLFSLDQMVNAYLVQLTES